MTALGLTSHLAESVDVIAFGIDPECPVQPAAFYEGLNIIIKFFLGDLIICLELDLH